MEIFDGVSKDDAFLINALPILAGCVLSDFIYNKSIVGMFL
jgi:hypothetical protein